MSLAIALVSVAGFEPAKDALADRDETRFTAYAAGQLDEISSFGGAGSTQSYGGGLAVAQGLCNWFDLGLAVGYRQRSEVALDGATLSGLGGDEQYKLYTDLQVFDAAIATRGYLEAGPFFRTRPLAGFRAGVQLFRFADPELFFGQNSVASAGTEWKASWLLGLEAGIAHRLTDSIELAWVLSATSSKAADSLLLSFEFSWQR